MKAASEANWAVHDQLHGNGGTTLCAVFIEDNRRVFGINAGDSRLYAIRSPNHVEQISRDDNLAALAENRKAPGLSNRLIQFVGMGQDVEFQFLELPPPTSDTAYLLTSDGAHSVDPEMFAPIVSSAATGNEVIRRLLSLSEWCGGKDNATAVFLPSLIKDLKQAPSSGVITITLHSTSRAREILIPTKNSLFEPERQYAPPQPLTSTPKSTPSDTEETAKRTASRSGGKKKKKKTKRTPQDEATLPLEGDGPSRLEVSYPLKR
jgi:hypothetical protein